MVKKKLSEKDVEKLATLVATSTGMLKAIYAQKAVPAIIIGLTESGDYAIVGLPDWTMEQAIAILESVVESYKCVVKGENN